MAQIPLIMLTAVDLRRADRNGTSRAITIAKLTVPSVKFASAEHNPGGGVLGVDFTLPRIEALEPKFDARGIDTEIFASMGERHAWTLAGAYRDKKTNRVLPARAVIEGVVAEWEPDESDPAEFQGCSHMFREVTHMDLSIDNDELVYVDFWERELRLKGKDIYADERQALGA